MSSEREPSVDTPLYNVYVRESDLGHIYDVVKELSSKGMHVEQVAEILGVVSGSIPGDAVADIQELPRIDAVVLDREVSLPDVPNAVGLGRWP